MKFKVIFKKKYPLSFALFSEKNLEEAKKIFEPKIVQEIITL